MKVKVAFYKGKGTFVDKLIRIWTKSKYSHVELMVNGEWYSVSPRDSALRKKKMMPKAGQWDYVHIPDANNKILDVFNENIGSKYDWAGIFFSQILPLSIDNRNRWFCSEFVAESLKNSGVDLSHISNWYSPGDLYRELSGHNEL